MTCNQGTSEKPIKNFYSLLLKGPSINIDMMGGQNRRFHHIEISVLNFDMMTGVKIDDFIISILMDGSKVLSEHNTLHPYAGAGYFVCMGLFVGALVHETLGV